MDRTVSALLIWAIGWRARRGSNRRVRCYLDQAPILVSHGTIEARLKADMTAPTVAIDLDLHHDGILITVDPQFVDMLKLTRRLALLPQALT
jgi:hypothetical protein